MWDTRSALLHKESKVVRSFACARARTRITPLTVHSTIYTISQRICSWKYNFARELNYRHGNEQQNATANTYLHKTERCYSLYKCAFSERFASIRFSFVRFFFLFYSFIYFLCFTSCISWQRLYSIHTQYSTDHRAQSTEHCCILYYPIFLFRFSSPMVSVLGIFME